MLKNVLVVAAHPDDEVLGCGATLAKAAEYYKVFVLFLNKGRDGSLEKAARNAARVLGITNVSGEKLNVEFNDLPDQAYESVPFNQITEIVSSAIDKIRPDTILTHSMKDINLDHRLTHQAVLTAARPIGWKRNIEIACFEVPSSTEWNPPNTFTPNVFVNVEDYLEKKLEALKCYGKEMREFPHPRSFEGVKNLALFRGQSVGMRAAEAFELIRKME